MAFIAAWCDTPKQPEIDALEAKYWNLETKSDALLRAIRKDGLGEVFLSSELRDRVKGSVWEHFVRDFVQSTHDECGDGALKVSKDNNFGYLYHNGRRIPDIHATTITSIVEKLNTFPAPSDLVVQGMSSVYNPQHSRPRSLRGSPASATTTSTVGTIRSSSLQLSASTAFTAFTATDRITRSLDVSTLGAYDTTIVASKATKDEKAGSTLSKTVMPSNDPSKTQMHSSRPSSSPTTIAKDPFGPFSYLPSIGALDLLSSVPQPFKPVLLNDFNNRIRIEFDKLRNCKESGDDGDGSGRSGPHKVALQFGKSIGSRISDWTRVLREVNVAAIEGKADTSCVGVGFIHASIPTSSTLTLTTTATSNSVSDRDTLTTTTNTAASPTPPTPTPVPNTDSKKPPPLQRIILTASSKWSESVAAYIKAANDLSTKVVLVPYLPSPYQKFYCDFTEVLAGLVFRGDKAIPHSIRSAFYRSLRLELDDIALNNSGDVEKWWNNESTDVNTPLTTPTPSPTPTPTAPSTPKTKQQSTKRPSRSPLSSPPSQSTSPLPPATQTASPKVQSIDPAVATVIDPAHSAKAAFRHYLCEMFNKTVKLSVVQQLFIGRNELHSNPPLNGPETCAAIYLLIRRDTQCVEALLAPHVPPSQSYAVRMGLPDDNALHSESGVAHEFTAAYAFAPATKACDRRCQILAPAYAFIWQILRPE